MDSGEFTLMNVFRHCRKILGAVNETMINGNLAGLLNSLVDISTETAADGMAFDHVVISGK